MDNIVAIDDPLVVTIIADSVSIDNYNQMALSQIVNNFIPCYGISNSLKTIGLKMTHSEPTVLPGTAEIRCHVELYGNLLLSRGIPAQYEPANFK